MSQIRAFLAIDLDDDLKPKINNVIEKFSEIDAKVKYVDLVNLHFTLKFFGDIDPEGIDLISEKITKVIKDFKPFNIEIKGCGAFPNKNRPKVIWLGVNGDEILKELHKKLDKQFTTIGFEADKKFSTHLTIGRMKSPKGRDEVKSTIESFKDIEIGEMEVNKIVLKKSTLTPSGPIYEDLKEFNL